MKPVMIIDLNRCTQCLACVEACIAENIARWRLEGGYTLPMDPVSYSRTRPFFIEEKGVRRHVFIQCMHCESPPCVDICPTGASYVDDLDTVQIDISRCIRCLYCVDACPYLVRRVYRGELSGVPRHGMALEPGYPDKCNLCIHRRSGDGLWTPACVEACPYGARIFGDLDDENSLVHRLVYEGKAIPPREELGTRPKLYIIPRSGGLELARYPARQKEFVFGYEFVGLLRRKLLRPLTYLGVGAAIVLGFIHMVRGRRSHDREVE